MYYFANLKESEGGGLIADLPRSVNYTMLSQPKWGSGWALYKCEDRTPEIEHPSVERAPFELALILSSAERYPPAIAFAGAEMEAHKWPHQTSRKSFTKQYLARLIYHLRRSSSTRYFLAEILKHPANLNECEGHIGFAGIHKGNYFWIVGYGPSKEDIQWVRWIDNDYSINISPVGDFKININRLRKIPRLEHFWRRTTRYRPVFVEGFEGVLAYESGVL